MHSGIVPPYLLERISTLEADHHAVAARAAKETLLLDRALRGLRAGEPPPPTMQPDGPPRMGMSTAPAAPKRTISDAATKEVTPGTVVRREGEAAVDDVSVNEAYDGLGATFALFEDIYQRNSIDGLGLPLNATVHYGSQYDNAFWDGGQMVFGDGDGEVFGRFTGSVSVIGHELAHGVTQYTAGLAYQGQSGALNESISDVFGALVEQYLGKQTAEQASWLIGAGLFTDKVQGVALRSMKAPGTAYDDDVLGKDPQPAHMDGYVTTKSDNGGVHLNSGIPNRAFYLASVAIGGNAWDGAGQIWYDTLVGESLSNTVKFAGFAAATIKTARKRFGADSTEAGAVQDSWTQVGVVTKGLRK